MSLDRLMFDARRDLAGHVERIPIPERPTTQATRPRRPRWTIGVVALAAVALVVVGIVAPRVERPQSISTAPAEAQADEIIPLDRTTAWRYALVAPSDASPAEFEIHTADHPIVADELGRTRWPTELLEPWRGPAACSDDEPLVLPSVTDLASAASTSQVIKATCGGVEVVGAARLSWRSDATQRTVAAGTFDAWVVEVSITGFGDPFPLELRYWIDPTVGIIAMEADGTAPGPERSAIAELVGVW